MAATVSWNGQTIIETDDFVVVEGNKYFRKDALKVGRRVS